MDLTTSLGLERVSSCIKKRGQIKNQWENQKLERRKLTFTVDESNLQVTSHCLLGCLAVNLKLELLLVLSDDKD